MGAICSEKRPVVTYQSWWKTVSFEEYVQNVTDKYPCNFSRQTGLVVFIIFDILLNKAKTVCETSFATR